MNHATHSLGAPALIAIIASLLVCTAPARANTDPWWNSDWSKRKQLLFDNSAQSTDLIGFPVLVQIDADRIDFTQTQSAGEDLRFTDADGTELPYEIEQWDPDGTCSVWVRVPQIDAESDTDYIWVYYANPLASDAQDAPGVWDDDYLLVWHGRQSPSTTVSDATGNNNDGTKKSSTEPEQASDGKIGVAQRFDGTDDGIEVPGLVPTLSITMEAWIRPRTHPGSWATVAQFDSARPFLGLSGTKFSFGRVSEELVSVGTVPLNEWTHIAATHAGSLARLYLNGAPDNAATVSNSELGSDLVVGVQNLGTSNIPFDGSIDELRISTIVRSPDWIAAQYLSMTDAFVTWDTPKVRVVQWREVGAGGNP